MTRQPMSKSEREDLQRLVRQREKVLKSAAKQRSAELIADFENQMGQAFAARCRELGIPAQFAPSLNFGWMPRGHENAVSQRRAELRRMARTQIEAIERKAITEIEVQCLEAQTQLALAGLTSQAALAFVEKLPSIETLMPKLSFAEIAGEAEPPVAEQLVSSNALRQRRYRERLRNRNAHQALRDATGVTDDKAEDAP
jgi:hypothetical protein